MERSQFRRKFELEAVKPVKDRGARCCKRHGILTCIMQLRKWVKEEFSVCRCQICRTRNWGRLRSVA
jgi:hypothetical protein